MKNQIDNRLARHIFYFADEHLIFSTLFLDCPMNFFVDSLLFLPIFIHFCYKDMKNKAEEEHWLLED